MWFTWESRYWLCRPLVHKFDCPIYKGVFLGTRCIDIHLRRERERLKLLIWGPLEKANLKLWIPVLPNMRTWPQEGQDLVQDNRILAQDCYPTLRKVTSVILTGTKPKPFWSKWQFTRLAKFLTELHINDKDKLFKIRSWRLKATGSLLHAAVNFLYFIRITSGKSSYNFYEVWWLLRY